MREEVRVATDAAYYEENAESVEFWSPGGWCLATGAPGRLDE